ncbi:MAG: hypothetical protein K2O24_01925 [Muribaculaceae bacterium]|nr:hypothetical protein [Muribaculaceae bacterium]
MIARRSVGAPVFASCAVAATLMTLVTLIPGIWHAACAPEGIVWPSPCQWGLPAMWSAVCAWGAMMLLALFAQLLNKSFDFITGTDMALPSIFLLLLASNPAISARFGSPLLLALASIAMLALAMDCYRATNGTQQIFVAATIGSVGCMCDTAFIIPLLWCVPAWGVMKCLRLRELVAFGLGLIAPWWCALGTGLVSPDSLDFASLMRWMVFNPPAPAEAVQIGAVCWWAFLAVILGLNTAVKLYAGNTRTRALNNIITLLGLAALAGMALNPSSLSAFTGIFYFAAAVQFAQMFVLWNIPRPRLWLWIGLLLIAAQFPLLLLV